MRKRRTDSAERPSTHRVGRTENLPLSPGIPPLPLPQVGRRRRKPFRSCAAQGERLFLRFLQKNT